MKRTISLLLAITMVLTLSFAAVSLAEASVLDRLGGMEWCFSSGAGGWSTDLWTQADGSFTGEYHDSEMGETGEGYPDGTIYVCRFSGQMSVAAQVDEKTKTSAIRLTLEVRSRDQMDKVIKQLQKKTDIIDVFRVTG